MRLWSDAFPEGGEIPLEYTKDGYNTSPPFRWADLPAGTREVALIFEGVTPATHKPWVHWLVYKIPPRVDGLPQGFKHMREPEGPLHVLQGSNSLGNVGYDGPQGTIGRKFRYRIRLLALDDPIDAQPGLDKKRFEEAVEGHVIEEAELHAVYERRS
jgi:Raf kinase inhibitor-like YbhB/YbcL family protein